MKNNRASYHGLCTKSNLEKNGFAHIERVFSGDFLDKIKRKNSKRWVAFKNSNVFYDNDGDVRKHTEFRGSTAIFLEKGRYDLALDFGIFRSKKFIENEKIMKIVHPISKTGFTYFAGSIPSAKGSDNGQWHRDTWSLFNDDKLDGSLPLYYITVLIPLVDLNLYNGPTEIILGSHKGGSTGKIVSIGGPAGSATIIDGRILHRGLANTSQKTRHMLYIVYCKKWYYEYHEDTCVA